MATLQINHITFSRLANAFHVQFFSNVKAGIEKYQIEKLGIDENAFGLFTRALNTEQDIVNRSRASVYTKDLQKFDTLRDNYFRRIYNKLRNAENDSLNEKMTPELITKINVRILSQYTLGICNESNQKETAKLRGFIKDLRIEFPASFEDLEIANDIEILEEANDNYEKAYMARISEQAALPQSTALREATEQAYLTLSFQIMTIANNPSATGEDMLKMKLCERLIGEINLLIKDFKSKAYVSGGTSEDADDEDFEEEITSDEEINSDEVISDEQ